MPKGAHKLLKRREQKHRIRLLNKGYNDSEMARKLGITREAVRQWRFKNRLEGNGKKIYITNMHRRSRLYRKGFTDREIAFKENSSIMAILMWRRRRNLEPN